MSSILPSNELRRLLDLGTIKYQMAVEGVLPYLAARGLSEEIVAIAGLGVVTGEVKEHAHLSGRLWIPYMTDAGVVNANARCIEDHNCKASGHKKYLKPYGLKDSLYGVRYYADATSTMCVTEGELDAITLHMLKIPAVAVSGASKWRDHWTNVLDDFARVVVLSDGDTAGREFVGRVREAIPHALDIPMPNGEDVNSTYLKHGGGYLRSRIGV